MRFHATNERALRTAKRLRDVANDTARLAVPATLGSAKEALALAWGYDGWAELTRCCEAGPRSAFDEEAEPQVASARLARHVRGLAAAFGLSEADATGLAVRAGLTSRAPKALGPRPVRAESVAEPANGPPPAPAMPLVPGFRIPDLDLHVLGLGGSVRDRGLLGLGILSSHLSEGRGCLFVDASGDAARHAAIRAMVGKAGEPDGPCVVDLREPTSRDPGGATFNPFATEDAAALARMLVGMHDADGTLSDPDRVGMAVVATSALEPLVRRRDAEGTRIRPSDVAGALRAVSTSGRGGPAEGHANVAAALCRVLEALGGVHGHVFDAEPTVDLGDAVARGRTVIVLLDAAVRKGAGHLPGHAVMAVLRRVAADGLGTPRDARWRDLAPADAAPVRRGYGVVLDGVGRYASAPDRPLFTQARSLGLMMACLAEDAGELRAAGRETARHIVGNATTRVLMHSDDPATRAMATSMSSGLPSVPPLSSLVHGEGITFERGAAWLASLAYDGSLRRVELAPAGRQAA